MYILKKLKKKKKKPIIDSIKINGVRFGLINKVYEVKNVSIRNLIVYNKKMIITVSNKNITNAYKKLLNSITSLLVDDDDDGTCIKHALNELDRFKRILDNKYKKYINDELYKEISNKIKIFEKETNKKIVEYRNINLIENYRGSRK